MKIKLNTLSEMPLVLDRYGEKVSALLNLGSNLKDQPFVLIEKKLFKGKGEIFTSDRFVSFESNGAFTKLKKQKNINYSDIVQMETFNGSTGLEWKFSGAPGDFRIGLVFYGRVKSINPRDIFWYEVDDFPGRSLGFYRLLKEVLPRTGLTSTLGVSSVKRRLEEAIALFEGSRTLEDIGLKLEGENAKYPGFTALQHAFASYLAGSATATETTRDGYLEIFRNLDGIYVRILRKLMTEYNSKLGNIFNREQKIYEADEKFQRLSSIWYLRQMVNLHFASEYLPKEKTGVWPMKVLKPRALVRSANKTRTVSIKLPEPEIFEEAIAALEK
jgi:hypothetical protein